MGSARCYDALTMGLRGMAKVPWRWAAGAISGSAVLLGTFLAVGHTQFNGWALHLGTTNGPTPWHGRFLAFWAVFGGASAILLAIGLWHVLAATRSAERLLAAWRQVPDSRWVVYGTIAAFALPAMLRARLLAGMPLTDDENAYRFAAAILAEGRLFFDSPPMKLFFDNLFLVNDGRIFTQYFLGWPALMVPALLAGVPGLANAFYSALTVPALFGVVRRLAGSDGAKAAVGLYLASPMLMVGAATETSHTSCVMALAWCVWFLMRAREPGSPVWAHAGLALLFSTAFFIRPTAALGLGTPVLVAWLAGLRASSGAERFRALAAFALPAAAMAALFLGVNQAQNGSWQDVGYQSYYQYARSNDFRFSIWQEEREVLVRNFEFGAPWKALGIVGLGLLRFQFALFGWPSSLVFVAFAGLGRSRLFWWLAASFLAVHFFVHDVGVDSFAPMHFYELALPALVLTVLGLRRLVSELDAHFPRRDGARVGWLAPLAAASLVAVTLVGYVPARFGAIHQMAAAVRTPFEALDEAGIERGVVFAPAPFIDRCKYYPAVAFLFSRPNNDPALENDVLWVNHLTVERDKELMAEVFTDREGYVMVWTSDCRVLYLPLAELGPDSVPPSRELAR